MGQMSGSTVAQAANQTAESAIQALTQARDRTLGLIQSVSDDDLERVHSTLMSPLVWDLGHIAAFEDLWLAHNYGGLELLRPELLDVYDAMETPRAHRGDLPFLNVAQAHDYLDQVRRRTIEVIEDQGIGDGLIHELVVRHEHQHNETMLQTLELARLEDYELPGHQPQPAPPERLTGLEMVEIPAGPCTIGASDAGFAYDNERPRHLVDLPRFLIGRAPVTNATYLHFVEGGGYQRREWWSDEGWAWKEQYDITRPGGWTADGRQEWRLGRLEPLNPEQPVAHISWFEADAFARAHDLRLPTESEWEKAATWDPGRGAARRFPWGDEPADPARHANVDHLGGGPAPAGAYPEGASAFGALGMIGDVWEWTGGEFGPYPGFVARPYREYSEPFFHAGYRVLRGGSWATRARVANPTFRNWDHPQRRQIFSGVRIASDA
jgi:iron(II)-dependent oxidoreductase